MKTITDKKFLRDVTKKGLALDPKYPDAAVLNYGATGESRFWQVPSKPERRPHFIAALLSLMGDWQHCCVRRRFGKWPAERKVDREWPGEMVHFRIVKGLGLALGSTVVVEFERSELDSLITLIFATTIFGGSQWTDLYIIPDHCDQVMQVDHHDVIHVDFRNAMDVDRWVAGMTSEGYVLPDNLPDWTFKQPDWMPDSAEE